MPDPALPRLREAIGHALLLLDLGRTADAVAVLRDTLRDSR